MLACASMGYVVFLLNIVPRQYIQSRWQLLKITILASAFCTSVVLGNVSLRFIPVSFNQVPLPPAPQCDDIAIIRCRNSVAHWLFVQAIGATTPFFTAIMALTCLGQRESMLVYSSLVPVVIGRPPLFVWQLRMHPGLLEPPTAWADSGPCAGIVVASGGEPLFNVTGFVAAIMATCGRAFKSVLQVSDPSRKAQLREPKSFRWQSRCRQT